MNCPPKKVALQIPAKKCSVVDLFCGAGGLSHGLKLEGFHIAAGVDIDGACEHAFETNNGAKFIREDVTGFGRGRLEGFFGEAETKILVGCAPCQPFSKYAQGLPESKKWFLLKEFGRLIAETEPDIVSMENVPGLANFKRSPIYNEFTGLLEKHGYNTKAEIVYGPDYGLPQTRTRLLLLASRLGQIDFVPKTHSPEKYTTVRQAIAHLPPIAAGGSSYRDRLHAAARLSELNLKRVRAAKAGGTWRDWEDKSLKLDCHEAETGNGYVSVYGRMSWDEPAPTMTTQCHGFGNGRFGHPEQDRAISLREAAILQSFPSDYEFVPKGAKIHFKTVARMIGNAVPVTLGRVVGQSIKQHLKAVGRL